MLENYYEDRLPLFPLEATAIADSRYNDQLPNFIGDEHRARQRAFYTKYQAALAQVDHKRLTGQDRLSHDVFKREMEMKLEGLRFLDEGSGA